MLLMVGKKCYVLYLKTVFKHLLAQQRKLTVCVSEHRRLVSWNFERDEVGLHAAKRRQL